MTLSPPTSPTRASTSTLLAPPPNPLSASSSSATSPVSATSGSTPIGRARSGSRTFSEAQADADQQRKEERQRAQEGEFQGGNDAGPEQGITPGELRAEMETLLSLRRRSLSQPAAVDPDLPPPSPPSPSHPNRSFLPTSSTSPTLPSSSSTTPRPLLSIQTAKANQLGPSGAPVSPTAPTAAETGTLVRRRSSNAQGKKPSDHPLPSPPPLPSPTTNSATPATTSPPPSPTALFDGRSAAHASQELFWLPASLHPELAPQEFKAFIREQTRPDNLARRTSMSAASGLLARANSSLGVGATTAGRLDRKKSMLRGEYKPRTDDGVGEEAGTAAEGRRPAGLTRGKSEGQETRRTSGRINFDELTIKDLQRLEELAAKAEAEGVTEGEGEGERLGRVLRRSLSLNPNLVAQAAAAGGAFSVDPTTTPATLASEDDRAVIGSSMVPSVDDDATSADSPLLVHSPGQILRRSARTKIRKTGLAGDGGGHRFGPSRRQRVASSEWAPPGGSDDSGLTTSEAGGAGDLSYDSIESLEDKAGSSEWDGVTAAAAVVAEGPPRSAASSPASSEGHRSTSTMETQFLENAMAIPTISAPSTTLADHERPNVVVIEKEVTPIHAPWPIKPLDAPLLARPVSPPAQPATTTTTAVDPSSADYDWATHNQQRPQRQARPRLAPVVPVVQIPERQDSAAPTPPPPAPVPVPVVQPSPSKSPTSAVKEKKSGWARLGLSVRSGAVSTFSDDKKKGKGKETTPSASMATTHVLDGAMLASNGQQPFVPSTQLPHEKEPGFFGGLFGKRKSEQEVPPVKGGGPPTPPLQEVIRQHPAPPPPTATAALLPTGEYINFYRLPIHVERAVYRLSHIKLANPRRPLYEQVLISNLMFWYLSIINRPTPPPMPVPVPIPVPQGLAAGGAAARLVNGADESSEHSASSLSTTLSNSLTSSSNSMAPASTSTTGKRGGLNKAGPGGGGRGSREVAIKPAQYEQQNRQIDQEYHHHHHHHHHHQQEHQQQQHQQQQQQQQQPPQQQQLPQIVPISTSTNAFSGSSSDAATGPLRSAERSSAPADMYSFSNGAPIVNDEYSHLSLSASSNPARRSSPPSSPHRTSPTAPTWTTTSPKQSNSGFEVTSRNNNNNINHKQARSVSSEALSTYSTDASGSNSRRTSNISNKSFDEESLIDAYGQASPVLGTATNTVGVVEPPESAVFGGVMPRGGGGATTGRRSVSSPASGGGGGGGGARAV